MNLFKRISNWALVSMVLIGHLGVVHLAHAETLETYQVKINQPNATLSLVFKQTPKFSYQRTNQGFILKFANALETPELSDARNKLTPWVASLWSSYDSILIKPHRGVTVDAKLDSKVINISFDSKQVRNKPTVSTSAKSRLSIERAKALLDMESGRALQARQKLIELSKNAPFDPQIKLDLARVEEKLNHWREALSLYDQALVLHPQSTSIAEMKANLLRLHGSRISLGAQYMEIGDDSRQLVLNMLNAQQLTKDQSVITVNYDRIDAEEDSAILRANGAMRPFNLSRHRFALSLTKPLKQAEQRFSLYSGARELGLGWAFTQATNYGLTALEIDWKRPWFETPEAIVGYGHRDSIALKHGYNFGKKLSLFGNLSQNRYGLKTLVGAAKSRRLEIGGRYQFQPTREGYSLGYGIDWENVNELRSKTRGTFFSSTYTPLPLETREQHTVDVGWYKKLRHNLVLDAQLGFQYDRRRSSSTPFTRVFLSSKPKPNLELKLSLENGLSTYRGQDEEFFRVASLLSWYF